MGGVVLGVVGVEVVVRGGAVTDTELVEAVVSVGVGLCMVHTSETDDGTTATDVVWVVATGATAATAAATAATAFCCCLLAPTAVCGVLAEPPSFADWDYKRTLGNGHTNVYNVYNKSYIILHNTLT